MNDNQMHIGFKQVLRRAFLLVWRGAYPQSPIEDNYQTALKQGRKRVLALTWRDVWIEGLKSPWDLQIVKDVKLIRVNDNAALQRSVIWAFMS